jgi:hypothetical protein
VGSGFDSLTGHWIGRYDQPSPSPSVAFEAELVEDAASFTGETSEPNTFRRDMGAELTATLVGGRAGNDVSFVKCYHGFGQGSDPVYDGVVNQGLTRIVGQWCFPSWPDVSGRFVMMRRPLAGSKAEVQERRSVPVGSD